MFPMIYSTQMRRIKIALLLVVLLVLQSSPAVHAATASTDPAPTTPLNITITPDAQELVVKPGGTVTASFQVRNNGLQTEHLKGTVKTFAASGTNGVPQLLDFKVHDESAHWVTVPNPTFNVEPNVWETFSLVIQPPKTAAFGYYYAVDFTRVSQAKATIGNTFVTSIDGLILLDVQAPGEKRQANLVEFSTPNKLVEFLPEHFTIRMHNSGNVHVAPRGNIFLYKGKTPVGIINVNATEGNILPGSNRVYTALWKDGTPVYKITTGKTKKGQPTDVVTLNWDNFKLSSLRYGKYTAQLEMIYNNGQYDVPLTAELSFWVIPWRIIAALVVIVLLVLAGVWALIIRPIRARIKGSKRHHGRFR